MNTLRAALPKLTVLPLQYYIGAVLILVLAASHADARQSTLDGMTPSGAAPGSPDGSYALSGFEDINLFNGNLNFHLPLLSMGGRGSARHTMTLSVNQRWTIEQSYNDMTGAYSNAPIPFGWNGIDPGYGPGVLQARHAGDGSLKCGTSLTGFYYIFTMTLTRLTFTSSDGTEYELRDALTGGQPQPKNCTNNATQFNRGRIFVTADGTSATFISDADITDRSRFAGQEGIVTAHSGYLLLRDGTRYRFDSGTVTWVRDRNGNLLSFGYDANKRVTSVVDPLGRQVTVAYSQAEGGQYGTCDRISFNGFSGTARVLRVCMTNLGSALRTTRPNDVATPQTYKALFPELNGSNYTAYDATVVSSVWLPDGQQRYQLFYNQYGELARLVLPTGGAIEYDHAGGYVGGNADGVVGLGSSRRAHINRRAVERRVYPDGTNLASRSTYSRPESMSGTTYLGSIGYVETDQLDAAGALQARQRSYFNGTVYHSFFGSPVNYSSWLDGREYKTEAFDSAGTTVLKRAERRWQQRAPVSWWNSTLGPEPPNDPRLVTTVTTAEPASANLVAKVTAIDPRDSTGQTVGFDQFNNQTDMWEYDSGTGAASAYPVRHAHTDYLTVNNGIDYTDLNGAHIRNLVSAQRVYSVNSSTGAEALAAQSETLYDETTLPLLTYGPVAGWADPGTAARGNATTNRSWLDTTNSWLGTHARYDQVGNVRFKWDARDTGLQNPAQIDYSVTYAYALPTTVTSPVPDSTGAFGSATALVTTNTYDFSTGLLTSTTDANNKTTNYSYADEQGAPDPLERLRKVTRPDGGKTKYEYGNTPGNLYRRTITDLEAVRAADSYQYFDGLGRPSRLIQFENADPAKPWVTSDTEYDALGRVRRTSQPYRAAAGAAFFSTDKWSETAYDGLGRVTSVTTRPDGAAVTTAYSGERVLVIDQADKERLSRTDALGRVTDVWEVTAPDPATVTIGTFPGHPEAAQGYQTTYVYDALGNLRTVTQGQQTRTFGYDSLSRVTSATNPERGAVSYTYDNNSNLLTKTDARGVTVTYGYDALNRNTTVRYSDAVLGAGNHTKDVDRHYDGAINGRGRFYYFNWDSSNNTRFDTHLAVDEYDEAGRPKKYRQHFLTNGAASPEFTVLRTYDFAGDIMTQTYPSGHTVSYQHDLLGRVADANGQPAFKGNLGDGVERAYTSEVRYQEMGGLEQERFGTATPVYNKSLYNGRNQLAEIRVSTYSITSSGHETDWNRGAIINHYSNAAGAWGATGGGPDNNGNLRRQEVYVPDDDQISGYFNVVQHYGYDALNRLASVEDKPFNSTTNLRQSYVYDRWGNRTIDAANTTNAPSPQFTASAATNRLSPPAGYTMGYDAAGNLTFDNYTGAGARAFDAENRMTSAQVSQYQTASYTFDADGRRVKRNDGTGEVWQVYGMEGELLAEYAANAPAWQPRTEYGYRGGELLVVAEPAAADTVWVEDSLPAGATPAGDGEGWNWVGSAPAPFSGAYSHQSNVVGWAHQHFFYAAAAKLSVGAGEKLYAYVYLDPANMPSEVMLQWNSDQEGWNHRAYWGANQIGWGTDGTGSRRYMGPLPASGQWVRLEVPASLTGLEGKTLNGMAFTLYGGRATWDRAGKVSAGTGVKWLIADQLGTPRMVIDQTGSLAGVRRHDYLPYGEEIPADGSWRTSTRGYTGDNVRQKFTGKERDWETNEDFFGARYLSSVQGRFTSADPAGAALTTPQGLNKYQYCLNNPLRYIDDQGRYNRDVHYDLTRLLAMAAGFSVADATRIATADQRVDEDENTEPMPNRKGAGYVRRKMYHFTTEKRRREMFAKFEASGSLDDLGVFLHAHQDSYSHRDYPALTGQFTINHWPSQWDDADDTWRDYVKADEMAQTSYEWLLCAASIAEQKGTAKTVGPPVPWGVISPHVHNFNAASTPEEKQYHLMVLEARIRAWYEAYWKKKLKEERRRRYRGKGDD